MTTRDLLDEGCANANEAAAFLGCSPTRVRDLCRSGALSHTRNGGRITIPRVALRQYAARKLVRGLVA